MGGYRPPLKNTVLGRLHQSTPSIRRISEKSAEPPRRMAQRGGDFRIFFSKFGDSMVWVPETSTEPCFLERGAAI